MQTIKLHQTVTLEASPQTVFDAWLDSKMHAAMVNGTAIIDPKVGGKFAIWDDLTGVTTKIDTKTHTIEQDWRDGGSDWPEGYHSHLIVVCKPHENNQTLLDFTQTDIPAEHYDDIKDGWIKFYWEPMQKYFKSLAK